MTMPNNENRPIFLPPLPPAIPVSPQPSSEGAEEDVSDEELEEERPPVDENSDDFIPELGLTEEDEDEIFGTGERLDGSLDELERSDVDDMLDVPDSIFSADEPKPKKRRFKRTPKGYPPTPPNLGSMQY